MRTQITPDAARPDSLLSKRDVLAALALAVLAFALFTPARGYDFVNYDDDLYVYENPAVLRGLSWSGLKYALTSGAAGTWAPITWLSYQADTTLQGAQARSYHTTNIAYHAMAGALLFLALRALRQSGWVSATVAAVFLVHPLRTDSVAWIAERKDVLCAMFWALGLLAYGYYVRRPGLARWSFVFVCFLGGVMSKMMMVTFPFVLLLLDVWPLDRAESNWPGLRMRGWPLLREKLPFFIGSALVVLVSARALDAVGTFAPMGADVVTRFSRIPGNYVFYLGKIFWPAHLSVLYPMQEVHISQALLQAALLVGVTMLAVWRARLMPWLLVGWLWFLGTLVPVIGFVPFAHFSVGDRYTYIPSLGLTLAVVAGVEQMTRRFAPGRWLLTAAVVAVCAVVTRADLPRWRDTFTLCEAALRVGPHYVTYYNRGLAFDKKGERQRALADFNAALALKPDFAMALCSRGNVRVALGDRAAALEDFNAAIALKPDFARALSSRGSVRNDLGDPTAALEDCTEAIRCDPSLASAWNNRGNIYSRLGDPARALADYDQAVRLAPGRSLYYSNRAASFFDLKKYPQAWADIQECERRGGQPHPGLVRALREALPQPPP